MIFIIKLTTIFGLLATTALCDVSPRQYLGVEWAGWGGNIFNDRWASKNNEITSTSIQTMTQKCQLVYPKGVSATPTIAGNVVYYPTWSGLFVALDYTDCSILWQINVTSLVNAYAPLSAAQNAVVASASRTSPSIQGDVLLFGTLANALLVAADLKTGKVLSVIQINPHPFAMVTQSPTVYNGVILVGGSSFEEEAVLVPGYKCCSFIGNFAGLAFDPFSSKFDVLWNFTTIPENMTGWAGAAVWGGQPSIDPLRNQVFIGTGNSYQVPAEYYECENNRTTTTGVDPCLPKDVWQESILAIDVLTGRPNWVRQMTSLDDYTLACGLGVVLPLDPPLCPQGERGPDAGMSFATSRCLLKPSSEI
jgi:glucose dehydrogenase